jgi:hypothetical protein
MATLGQVGDLVTEQLRERVDRLVEAVEEEAPDFSEVSRLADSVSELADKVGAIYREVEQALGGGQQDDFSARRGDGDDSRSQNGNSSNSPEAEDVTKDELLERAREVNVQGRSSMTKDELAEAVEAEESQTKDELLERAQQAGIEGRSSMTKDELRAALTEANA